MSARHVQRFFAGGLFLAALVVAAGHARSGGTSEAGGEVVPPIASAADSLPLMRAGLDAESLIAAGVAVASIDDAVNDAQSEIGEDPTALSNADADYVAAKRQYEVLVRKVRSGLASEEEVAECQSRRSAWESAQAARQARLDAIFEVGVASLSTEIQARLRVLRANRQAWELPIEYLVAERTQAQWVELRDAVATRRIHEKYGHDFPQAVQVYLAQVDGDDDVSAARVGVDTYLAAGQTAWNSAVSD